MKRQTICLLVACLFAFAVPAAAKKHSKQNPAALALFKKAIQLSDIQSENSTPFRLQATARIFNGQGQESDGLFVVFWAPGKRWRTEAMFPGYTETSGRDGSTLWSKKSYEYEPYPVSLLWQEISFGDTLRSFIAKPRANASETEKPRRKPTQLPLDKPKPRKGTDNECVRAAGFYQFCFDPSTRLVQTFGQAGPLRFEYGDYQPFGSKLFPRTMRILYPNGKKMVELQVTSVLSLKTPNPALFAPVAGAKERSAPARLNCGPGKVIRAKITHEVIPIYPAQAKDHGIEGTVMMYVTIGKDGVPHMLWVVNSPSPLLSAAAVEAVRQWRYRPTEFVCSQGNQVIVSLLDVNTIITVHFRL